MYHLYVKTFIPRKEAIFMNRNFKGIYASLIREFVSLKRSMGFKYIGGEFVLTLFDRFTIERNETAIGITKELSDAWCKERDNESNSYHYRRCYILGAFSSFLNQKRNPLIYTKNPVIEKYLYPSYLFIKRDRTNFYDM